MQGNQGNQWKHGNPREPREHMHPMLTFKESVHINTALTMIATGSRRVFPAGNLTLGLAISRSATNRTNWFIKSTVESTNDEKMA